ASNPLSSNSTPAVPLLGSGLPPMPISPSANTTLPGAPPVPPYPPAVSMPQPAHDIHSATEPAIKGLPPLPPGPGVATGPSHLPNYVTAGAGNGPAPPTPAAPPPPAPQPGWTTDDNPNYWEGRQLTDPTIFAVDAKTLGPRFWASADYLFWFVKNA